MTGGTRIKNRNKGGVQYTGLILATHLLVKRLVRFRFLPLTKLTFIITK